MDERDWLILQILYKHGNITRTAEELYTSQPSITKRLRQMEKEFGVKIAQRGRRGIHFTPQGEFLAKSADNILFQIQKIKEKVRDMDNQVAGTLRIGASNYFAKYQLPSILKKFKTLYPLVEFQVTTDWSREIYHMVYNQQIHLGFVRGEYSWPEESYLLIEEPLCVASVEEIKLANLPQLPRIDYQTEPLFKTLLDNWWIENYTEPPQIGIKVDKVDTCREMILNGLGYAIVPSLLVENDEEVHKINIFDSTGQPLKRQTWLHYYTETLEINIVQAFVQFIKTSHLSFR